MHNLVSEWVDFSKLSQIWAKIGSNFKKILEKSGDFAQNLVQNWSNWYMNRLLFLEKMVFVWVYFQIPRWHIPIKAKREFTPPPPHESLV